MLCIYKIDFLWRLFFFILFYLRCGIRRSLILFIFVYLEVDVMLKFLICFVLSLMEKWRFVYFLVIVWLVRDIRFNFFVLVLLLFLGMLFFRRSLFFFVNLFRLVFYLMLDFRKIYIFFFLVGCSFLLFYLCVYLCVSFSIFFLMFCRCCWISINVFFYYLLWIFLMIIFCLLFWN